MSLHLQPIGLNQTWKTLLRPFAVLVLTLMTSQSSSRRWSQSRWNRSSPSSPSHEAPPTSTMGPGRLVRLASVVREPRHCRLKMRKALITYLRISLPYLQLKERMIRVMVCVRISACVCMCVHTYQRQMMICKEGASTLMLCPTLPPQQSLDVDVHMHACVTVTGRKRTLFHCKWANSIPY